MKLSEFFETHGWCQGAPARDASGEKCEAFDTTAVSWCMFGGACRIHDVDDHATPEDEAAWCSLNDRLEKAAESRGFKSYSQWQDIPGRTKDEVIALCKSIGE